MTRTCSRKHDTGLLIINPRPDRDLAHRGDQFITQQLIMPFENEDLARQVASKAGIRLNDCADIEEFFSNSASMPSIPARIALSACVHASFGRARRPNCTRCGRSTSGGVHAVAFGKPVGLSDDQLDSTVHSGSDEPCWDPPQRTALRLVGEFHNTRTVSDALFTELAALFDHRQILELTATAGWHHSNRIHHRRRQHRRNLPTDRPTRTSAQSHPRNRQPETRDHNAPLPTSSPCRRAPAPGQERRSRFPADDLEGIEPRRWTRRLSAAHSAPGRSGRNETWGCDRHAKLVSFLVT